MALLVFASAALAMRGRALAAIPAPAWLLFALAGYTAFQALPLPDAWVEFLSPQAAEVWRRAHEIAPQGRWMSLSLDRGATWLEALKWSMYGAAFVSAATYGAARSAMRGLLLVLACPVLTAIVTLAHGLAGARLIYGFYEPTVSRSIWHTGPLLNPNHLASFLNFGIFVGLGLMVAKRRALPAWALGLAVAFLIPNAVVAGSRGGIVGLVAGLIAFVILLPRGRRADPEFGPVPGALVLGGISAVFVLATGFTALLASDQTARQLYEVNVDKLRLLQWCGGMIADYPWFGVGRGAFESSFVAYKFGATNELYSHPENLPAQWLGEWGLPVGLAAFLACGWLLRPRRLGTRRLAMATGVSAGLIAIVIQNLVDFGLEVPAIALTVTVALGICWGQANSSSRRAGDAASVDVRTGFLGWAALASLLIAGVLFGGYKPLVYERRALARAYGSVDEGAPAALEELRRLTQAQVTKHPSEPYFYRLGALLTWRLGGDPIPWLDRAVERGPSVGRTHLLVARVVAARRALRQALLELRLAVTFDPNLAQAAAKTVTAWSYDYDDLQRAVPPGEDGIQMMSFIARADAKDPLTRERILTEMVARDPHRGASLVALAGFYVQELEHSTQSQRCAAEQAKDCFQLAEQWLGKLEQVGNGDLEAMLLRARLLSARGELSAAVEFLAQRCGRLLGAARSRCLQKRLDLAFADKQTADFSAAARDYLKDGCVDSEQCASTLEKLADMSSNRGNLQEAFGYYQRAAVERSSDLLWMKVARVGVRIRAFGQATNALEHIRSKSRFEPEYSDLLRSAAQGLNRTGG